MRQFSIKWMVLHVFLAMVCASALVLMGTLSHQTDVEKYQEIKQIDNNELAFKKAIQNGTGVVLAYGTFRSSEVFTIPDVEGEFSKVEIAHQEQEIRTRTVTSIVNGKNTTTLQPYTTWDTKSTDTQVSPTFVFLGVEIAYDMMNLKTEHITTKDTGSDTKDVYYATQSSITGTIEATYENGKITSFKLYENKNLEEAIKKLTAPTELIVAVVIAILGVLAVVVVDIILLKKKDYNCEVCCYRK